MKIEKRGDIVFLIEEIPQLPDFPPIERVIPVMTKEVFKQCVKEWLDEVKE